MDYVNRKYANKPQVGADALGQIIRVGMARRRAFAHSTFADLMPGEGTCAHPRAAG